MAVKAVRGAIQIKKNNKSFIEKGVVKLVTTIIKNNKLLTENIISIIFSQTTDLNVMNPAAALRTVGFANTPLFCTQEPDVSGSMKRVIRVIITAESMVNLVPVYLEGAQNLRPDLGKK